jgi:hypothetical protein
LTNGPIALGSNNNSDPQRFNQTKSKSEDAVHQNVTKFNQNDTNKSNKISIILSTVLLAMSFAAGMIFMTIVSRMGTEIGEFLSFNK